jgi:glyoxylase-like metal-dependent hydrolase (beta-lactamase superfamily II)
LRTAMMHIRFYVVTVSFLALSIPVRVWAQPAQVYLDSAVLAMGGSEALLAIKSQRIVSHGESFEPEQTVQPGAEVPRKVSTFTCTLLRDLNSGKVRYEWQRQSLYPFTLTWKYTEIINGDEGVIIGADGGRSPAKRSASAARIAARRKELSRAPASILINALTRAKSLLRLADQIIRGRQHYVVAFTDRGHQVLLVVDADTRLLRKVVFLEDDPVAGDIQNELIFDDWRQVGAVKLPFSLQYRVNGHDVATETIDTLENDVDIKDSDFEIPEELEHIDENDGSWGEYRSLWLLRRIALVSPLDDLQTKVQLTEVGKGVYHLTGGTHHSLAVEMKDHLVVIDAPLYEERSRAVLTALESRFPGKPIRTLVSTHFHNDHSGGLRAYAAVGATIVTGKASEAFVKKMLEAPHTYVPDSLQKEPKPGVIETVEQERKIITDGERTVEVYPVANSHAEGMLVAYVPHAKLLFVADLFSPGAARQPPDLPRELLDSLTAANVQVERIVGGHGNKVGTIAELRQAASQ